MGSVHSLRPAAPADVTDAWIRSAELGDALSCIEKIMGPDDEQIRILSNDLRGLFKVLRREAAAISELLQPQP